jgi:hypothetical protein
MEIAIGILYDFVLSFHGFYAGRTHDVLSEHYYIPLNFPLQPNFLTLLLHIRETLNSYGLNHLPRYGLREHLTDRLERLRAVVAIHFVYFYTRSSRLKFIHKGSPT